MEMEILREIEKMESGDCVKDVVVLHINHCMDNSFSFNEVLDRLFSKLVFVAVPYNNRKAETGYPYPCYWASYHENSYCLMKNQSELGIYSCGFTKTVMDLIGEALQREIVPELQAGKKLLVIEDGGYHFEALQGIRKLWPDIDRQILGVVEQTTSGTKNSFDSADSYRYPYPCASVARSDVKMHLESVFIGQRIVEELSGLLCAANSFLSFHQVLLAGYGIIGRSVAKVLDGMLCRMAVYDTDQEVLKLAEREGYQTYTKASEEMFLKDSIVIGCAGRPSFDRELFLAYLNGEGSNVYLASGSSKTLEFSYFTGYISGQEAEIEGLEQKGRIHHECYDLYQFLYHGVPKNVYLIAEGKPVNFYREDTISLTYRMIDLIFSEMLLLGLYLCRHRDLYPALYLLGDDNPLTKEISEDRLIRLWEEKNQLCDLENVLDIHPLADKLRKKML